MKRVINKYEAAKRKKMMIISIIIGLVLSSAILFIYKMPLYSIIAFVSTVALINVYFYFKDNLDKTARVKKIEAVFPDFMQLTSSNLRAGMTIDKALLLSSRPEFAPLDAEILKTGKDIVTSKNLEKALTEMGERIGSEKIKKTILLIISGIRSGGDLAILLEETSINMRERDFVEKKAYSSVMMYVIFIFLVVAIFAPGLFSLSNVLVGVLTRILSGIPKVDSSISLPMSLSNVNISIDFILYFSLVFIVVIDVLASLMLGLVSKGEEKEGLKYLPIMLVLSLGIFFIGKYFIAVFLSGFL